MIWVSWYHFAWQSEIMLSNFIAIGVTHSLTSFLAFYLKSRHQFSLTQIVIYSVPQRRSRKSF